MEYCVSNATLMTPDVEPGADNVLTPYSILITSDSILGVETPYSVLSLHTRRLAVPRHAILLGLTALLLVVGCGRKSVPAPAPSVPPPAVPAPAPAPVPSKPVVFAIPARVSDTRYKVESVADVERDSAGRKDTQRLSSQAQVLVRMRRRPNGGLEASGRVYKYAVSSALSATPLAIDSLRFDAVLDSAALRVFTLPPLANECDRPESGALALTRNLLIRVPASLSVGDQWRDSTVQMVCRASLPLIVHTTSEYVVSDSAPGNDGMQLVVRRTSNTRMEGKSTSPWRAVEVSGVGTSTLFAFVSVKSGAVQRVEDTSSITLTVTDRSSSAAARAQRVTQRVKLTASIIN